MCEIVKKGTAHVLLILLLVLIFTISLVSVGAVKPMEVSAALDKKNDVKYDEDGKANEGQKTVGQWQNSDAQKWCRNFYYAVFSDVEKSYILDSGVYGELESPYKSPEYENPGNPYEYTASDLRYGDGKDQVFFLSAEEVMKYFKYHERLSAVGNAATSLDGEYLMWWLRSPVVDRSDYEYADRALLNAGIIYSSGRFGCSYTNASNYNYYTSQWLGGKRYGARPALYLDLTADIGLCESGDGTYRIVAADSDQATIKGFDDVSDALEPYYTGEDSELNENCTRLLMGADGSDENGLIGEARWRVLAFDEYGEAVLLLSENAWQGKATDPPEKADAPTVEAKDSTTAAVTGKADEEFIAVPKGQEPTEADWNNAVKAGTDGKAEIAGLTPGAGYDVYARKAADDTHNAGPASEPASVTMPKSDQEAPAAPADNAITKTDKSITIDPTEDGNQYIVVPKGTTPSEDDWNSKGKTDTGDDVTSLTFDGLDPNTDYDVLVRKPGDDTHNPSPASTPKTVKTEKSDQSAPSVSGVDATSRKANDGKITGADTSMVYSTDGGQTWNPVTGSEITGLAPGEVQVKYPETETAKESPVTIVTIGVKPNVDPEDITKDSHSITIDPTEKGHEYIVVPKGETPSDDDWSNKGKKSEDGEAITFDGLDPNTEYDVISRKPSADPDTEPEVSDPVTVTTDKEDQDAPVGVKGVDASKEGANDGKVTGVEPGMEYSTDGGETWIPVTGDKITGLAPGKVRVRYSGSDTKNPSPAVEIEIGVKPEVKVIYECVLGNQQIWTKGSNVTADFTFKRNVEDSETFGLFTGIKVDGKDVAVSNYDKSKGSVNIDLKPAYLETLSAGNHRITAEFTDGSADASFTVADAGNKDGSGDAANNSGKNGNNNGSGKSKDVSTGDSNNIAAFLITFVTAAAGCIVLAARRRRSEK